MVSLVAHQERSGIGDFGGDDGPGDCQRLLFIIRHSVLRFTQQHVAMLRPIYLGQEFPVFAEKTDPDVVLGAEGHQRRGEGLEPETDDVFDGVDGSLEDFFVVHLHHKGIAFLANISLVRGDVEGVEVFFHGV